MVFLQGFLGANSTLKMESTKLLITIVVSAVDRMSMFTDEVCPVLGCAKALSAPPLSGGRRC